MRLTSDEKLQIANLYKENVGVQQIADIFGVTKVRISQIAREYGLKRQDKVLTYSKDEVTNMYDMYLNGANVEEISDIYGCNRLSIYNLFHRYGFNLVDDRHRVYSVDDTYFDNVDTSNKAYILGFLWADGHNNTRKGIVEMRLQERDKHILDDISDEMHNERPLYYIREKGSNQQDTYKICITSRQISDALLSYGMPSNKTYILEWPKHLRDDLIPHFLRGFTDGDGSIGSSFVEWVGTKMMMEKIQEILFAHLGISCTICNTRTDIIKTIKIGRKKYIQAILEWIYKDADLKLNRKFMKYQEIVNKTNKE